jgi:hypothetical protein
MDAFTEDWNESQFWVSSIFRSLLSLACRFDVFRPADLHEISSSASSCCVVEQDVVFDQAFVHDFRSDWISKSGILTHGQLIVNTAPVFGRDGNSSGKGAAGRRYPRQCHRCGIGAERLCGAAKSRSKYLFSR